ncbi:hypothetical protein OIY81_3134 [Cryptosporidium canis]|uniref:GAF domain-containing protein n=1 Tax=Cryptosporidium canis TaxID=195482 RepID=A0ABQ8P5J0_9CRYT|nr:hypothetical protein OIY81_3134 [Cryptosporidium canis]KAJ1609043.1 hypothetical protein OJ252_2333 [Cryptosporidium canis]
MLSTGVFNTFKRYGESWDWPEQLAENGHNLEGRQVLDGGQLRKVAGVPIIVSEEHIGAAFLFKGVGEFGGDDHAAPYVAA